MKALRYYDIHDLRVEDIEKPSCGPGEALIKIEYAGICGSDLHIYNKGMFIINIPETMGHEFVGVIEETGDGVTGFKPGDAVVANPMVPCMECDSCRNGSFNTCEGLSFIGEIRQGCFTEYIVMPADTLIRVPEGAALRDTALTEPLAVALNTCERAAFKPDDRVAVIGAGPIGLLTVIAAKSLYGVKDITVADTSPARLKLAEKAGASSVYTTLPDGMKFGKVVEAAGKTGAFKAALEHTEANGDLYVVSIFEDELTVDINLLVASQVTLTGCNVYTHEHLKDAAEAIASGKVDVSMLISEVFPLEKGPEAFELLSSSDKSAAKILLKP